MKWRNSISLSVSVSNHFTPLNFRGGFIVRPLWRLFRLFAVNLFSSGVRLLTDTLLRRRLVALLFRFVFLVSGRVSLCVSQQVCVSGDSSCTELAGDSKKVESINPKQTDVGSLLFSRRLVLLLYFCLQFVSFSVNSPSYITE